MGYEGQDTGYVVIARSLRRGNLGWGGHSVAKKPRRTGLLRSQ